MRCTNFAVSSPTFAARKTISLVINRTQRQAARSARTPAGHSQPTAASGQLLQRALVSAGCSLCTFAAPANFRGQRNQKAQHNHTAQQHRDAARQAKGSFKQLSGHSFSTAARASSAARASLPYFPFRCVCASRIVRLADTICFRCVIVPLYVRAARDFSPTRSAASRRSQTLLAFLTSAEPARHLHVSFMHDTTALFRCGGERQHVPAHTRDAGKVTQRDMMHYRQSGVL